MDTITLKQALAELLKRGLIVPVRQSTPRLDRMFYDALRINLSKAIGPMAEILIEDQAEEMEIDPALIPVNQAAELIAHLSLEVPDEENRMQFKKSMLAVLNKFRG